MGYVKLMMDAHEKDEVLKVVDGKLTSGEPSFLQKAAGFFGVGEYSQITVANFLNEHSKSILKEASEMYKDGAKIAPIQEQIDSVFAKAGMVNEGIDVFSNIYSNWMGGLPDSIKDKAVHDLLLPGTHDSVATHYDYSKPIHYEGGNSGFVALNKFFSIPIIGSFIGKYTVGDWGENQSMTIKEQLEHGIRAFDIRVAYDNESGELLVSHTFTVGSLEDTLKQFKEFMDEHPTEVVLIDVVRDWVYRSPALMDKSSSPYKKLTDLVNEYLGDKLLPPKDSHITLKDAVEAGKTAVVNFTKIPGDGDIHNNAFLGGGGGANAIEVQVQKADIKFSDEHGQIARGNGPFKTYDYTVTPDSKMIVNGITHGGPMSQLWGIKAMATELNSHFPEFLEKHPNAGDKVTGFLFDNPNNELIETVIQHNLYDYDG